MERPLGTKDVLVYAVSEDGYMLLADAAGSIEAARAKVVTRTTAGLDPQARYRMRYPEGYDVEWIDDPAHDRRLLSAMQAYRRRGSEGDVRL